MRNRLRRGMALAALLAVGSPQAWSQDHSKVLRVDTVLLGDMKTAGRLSAVDLPPGRFLPMAEAAVTLAGKAYAVPHWACGNFMFYRATDRAIGDAQTWSQVKKALNGAALVG